MDSPPRSDSNTEAPTRHCTTTTVLHDYPHLVKEADATYVQVARISRSIRSLL